MSRRSLAGVAKVKRGSVVSATFRRPIEPWTRSKHSVSYRPAVSSNRDLNSGHIRFYATQTSSSHAPDNEAGPSNFPMISAKDTYDVVIIGGGNAGLALACALIDQPSIRATSRILLLEGGSLDRVRAWTGDGPWENRVSSLTAENVAWLRKIGVWQYIEEGRSCPVDEMVIWSNPTPDSTPSIHFPPLGRPMARMTENTNLQRALLRRIAEKGEGIVEIRENARVGEMLLDEGERSVGLRIGDSWVRGSVVVGADGFNSPVRKFSGIESYGHPYPTHAVVATLHHDAPQYPNNTAFQRFLPTGPIAFLPLSSTTSTLVWSTHPSHAAAYKRLSPEALTLMVNAGFTLHEAPLASLVDKILDADQTGTPLDTETIRQSILNLNLAGRASLTSEDAILPPTVTSIPVKSIASFPLRLSHSQEYFGTRTVLVGDAAHTTHPLAGQGLNMGLADVRVLAKVWEDTKRTGGDIGSKMDCRAYTKERYPANQLLLTTTDTLHHVFSNRSRPVNWARGIGLDIINELGPLKRVLMQGAGAGAGGAGDEVTPGSRRSQSWGETAANGVQGWLNLKATLGAAAGMAGEAAKSGLRRAADALERR